MKYLFINSVYGVRSTGKLIASKCRALQSEGHICYAAYGREAVDDGEVKLIKIGSSLDYMVHALLSRVLDIHGLASRRATRRFLREIEKLDIDCIWLHNIHGYYINYELLFGWLKTHGEIKVMWTLHDCWAFTGHCAYFTMAKCNKWREGCHACAQLYAYPRAMHFDHSKKNYSRKKNAFCGLKNLTLVAPSKWLAGLTRESFLKDYPVEISPNTIDTAVFRPVESDFRKKYNLGNKRIVLGVAVGWEETKGFQDMLELRKKLGDEFVIVLVGVTESQIASLPEGIVGIEKTANQEQLAKIYTASDVFVNPTHQDNYPTVNLEAVACGTPVVTYNVGGSPESALPENVVNENDIDGLASRIIEICK